MVKKQALVALVSLISIVSTAFGLGLGDIKVNSNLNDPLDAEIDLLQLQGLTAGEILPTLASNDDFRRAGVERSFFLSNIQFRTVENEAGDIVVRLTTKQAVREPFLNFLVEVNWPGGRLLKEYTVLLDPPVFDTGLAVNALEVDRSVKTPGNSNITDLTTTTVVDSADVADVVTPAPTVKPRQDNLGPGQYRVQRNDTLWEIALKVPDRGSYSPQQVMLAIQDLNPEAFLGSNINRVKAGSVLDLPSAAQISSRTLDEAIAEVQAQNRGSAPNLREPVDASEVQLSATESTASALPGADGDKNPDGYLELTSDSEATTATASGETAATIDQLQSQLAAVEELNDQYQLERQELESQVQELQEQIQIMERLLEVQNSDLAEIQQAAAVAEEQAQAASEPAVPQPAAAPPEPAPAAAEAPKPVPVAPPPPMQPEPGIMGAIASMIGWVTASITNMAIVVGALLVMILLPLYIRSKRNQEESLEDFADPLDESETVDDDDMMPTIDEDLLSAVEDDFDEEDSNEPEALDAVVEAEMYMAYQKFDQAEEKLKEAYAEYPDRTDVAVKLLEVYAETGDANAFKSLEGQLQLDSGQRQQVADLRAKLPVGLAADENDLAPDLSTDDFDLDLGTDEDNSSSDLGSDLDFDLDLGTDDNSDAALDLDLDTGSSVDSIATELDFNLDDDEPASANQAPEPAVELDTDLDFSLDLDGLDAPELSSEDDLSLTGVEPEPAVEDSANTDLDFSLDLDAVDLSDPLDSPSSGDDAPELDLDDMNLDLDNAAANAGLDLDNAAANAGLDLDLGDLDADLTSSSEVSLDFDNDSADLSLDTDLDLDLDRSTEDVVAHMPGLQVSETAEPDPLQQLADSLDSDADLEEDEFDFLSGNDEASTKLDLARAYIEMEDKEGARDILEEVATEGNAEQKAQAQELLGQL